MKTILVLLLAILCSGSILQARESLIRVDLKDRVELQSLADDGFDIVKVGADFCDLIVDQDSLAALVKRKTAYRVLESDLLAKIRPILQKVDLGLYYTLEESNAELKKLAEKHPGLVSLFEAGLTHEGRTMYGVKLSDNVTETEEEARVLFTGATHAREWTTVNIVHEILKRLLEGYESNDAPLKALVDNLEIYLIPVANPDGYHHSQTSYKMWRKNRRLNDTKTFGVDLNRNFGYKWGTGGSSTYPGSDTYMGPQGFSEPEALAIQTLEGRVGFHVSLSFHSYSELILWPWGFSKTNCPDHATFARLAGEMAKFNQYTCHPASGLYIASGVDMDWLYGEHGIYAFCFELGTSFIPPESEIPNQLESNFQACRYLLEQSLELPPSAQASASAPAGARLHASLAYLLRLHRAIGYHENLLPRDLLQSTRKPDGKKPIGYLSRQEDGKKKIGYLEADQALVERISRMKDLFGTTLREICQAADADPALFERSREDFLKGSSFPGDRQALAGAIEKMQRPARLIRELNR